MLRKKVRASSNKYLILRLLRQNRTLGSVTSERLLEKLRETTQSYRSLCSFV